MTYVLSQWSLIDLRMSIYNSLYIDTASEMRVTNEVLTIKNAKIGIISAVSHFMIIENLQTVLSPPFCVS